MTRHRPQCHPACAVVVAIAMVLVAPAARAQAHLCDAAAADASRTTGVPLDVLRTVARVETGRSRHGIIEPWPWALNISGEGVWHETADAALRQAQQVIASGRRNVDIGCFQLNYRWHGGEFADLRQMMDPSENARYAADFLRRLFLELGDWTRAVGAYHSRTPEYAQRYLGRYMRLLAELPGSATQTPVLSADTPRSAGPYALSRAARPSILGPAGPGLRRGHAATPFVAARARPLWERP